MMADLPQFISYIENNLLRRLDIKTEDDLFAGDGTGDNLKGLISYATLFSAGPEAATVPDANEYDVLDALTTQVEVAFGSANAVYVHPRTVSKLRKLKDDNGLYIFPKTLPDALMEVNGMKILKSTAIGADEFVGGDLSVVNVLIREDLGLQIGLDGNDFTSNKKTMLAEKRLVQFVSANDTQVIVKGDFTTAKASLLKV
jgi:HK97 family phage major capsid protein